MGSFVFTGDGFAHEDLAIEITDGVITYANTIAGYTAPPGATVIDASGKTVMPGIVDAYVRGTENISGRPNGVRTQFVMDGVTTTCNVGHEIEGLASLTLGPWFEGEPIGRGFGSGPQLVPEIPDDLPAEAKSRLRSVSSESEIHEAIQEHSAAGAAYVNISIDQTLDPKAPNSTTEAFSATQIDQIIAEAGTVGAHVRASVIDEKWINRAVGKQIQVIDFTPRFSSVDYEWVQVLPGSELYDEFLQNFGPGIYFRLIVPTADAMADIRDRGAILVPMISVMDRTQPWTRPGTSPPESLYEDVVDIFHSSSESQVAYGSGYDQGLTPGVSMAEVRALKRAGMSNQEIITAMTSTAAIACGVAEGLGTLHIGSKGDVIVLDGDAGTDIDALDRVTHVILDGKLAKGE